MRARAKTLFPKSVVRAKHGALYESAEVSGLRITATRKKMVMLKEQKPHSAGAHCLSRHPSLRNRIVLRANRPWATSLLQIHISPCHPSCSRASPHTPSPLGMPCCVFLLCCVCEHMCMSLNIKLLILCSDFLAVCFKSVCGHVLHCLYSLHTMPSCF